MVVTTFAVYVAVGNFFLGSVADGNDLDLEVQALACQRVVAVDGDIVAVQVADGHDLHLAVRSGGVELHAHFQFVDAFEHAAAQGAGADAAAVRAAIRGGFAESKILEVHGQRMLERNFVAGGQVKSQIKDMHNILAAAEAAHVTLPVTQLVTQRYETLAATHPTADHAAALLALEALNPDQRLGAGPDQLS